MSIKGLNPSRLGEALLKSEKTPADVKEKVARKMRSTYAKEFVAKLELKRSCREPDEELQELMEQRQKISQSGAQAQEIARQETLDTYVVKEAAIPKDLFNVRVLALHGRVLLSVPHSISRCDKQILPKVSREPATYVREDAALGCHCKLSHAAGALYGSYLQLMCLCMLLCVQLRGLLSGNLLDEVYAEAQAFTQMKLDEMPGRCTLGIDGHKMGKRQVETLTRAKLGISTFLSVQMLGSRRATGQHLFQVCKKFLDASYIAVVADNTGNNTGTRNGLFALLKNEYPTLLCIGCCVHVLDLLIEDVAKVRPVLGLLPL